MPTPLMARPRIDPQPWPEEGRRLLLFVVNSPSLRRPLPQLIRTTTRVTSTIRLLVKLRQVVIQYLRTKNHNTHLSSLLRSPPRPFITLIIGTLLPRPNSRRRSPLLPGPTRRRTCSRPRIASRLRSVRIPSLLLLLPLHRRPRPTTHPRLRGGSNPLRPIAGSLIRITGADARVFKATDHRTEEGRVEDQVRRVEVSPVQVGRQR